MKDSADRNLDDFAHRHHLEGLTQASLQAIFSAKRGYSLDEARRFLAFQQRIDQELLRHRIIVANPYTAWFKKGGQSAEQVRAFIVQFSVFSNLFLVAQLYKTINANTLEGMHASKEILANEIGVVFRSRQAGPEDTGGAAAPELVAAEGSVEGGRFHFRAAHFEWLYRIARELGLGFDEIGKRRHGIPSTLYFCDQLIRLYGSEDYSVSQAASYAVENWAAAGFWEELIEGLERYNARSGARQLPLAFFTWHDRLEAQHALHTQEELEELYFGQGVEDEDRFIRVGNEMLNAVAVFWEGLDEQRRRLAGGEARYCRQPD